MNNESLAFLKELLETSAPAGFESPAQNVFKNFVTPCADQIETDVHGNVMALKKGKGNRRIMLSAHIDEIGFVVKYISDDGFIHFASIGNVDYALLPGLRVTIYHEGNMIRGIVGTRPLHTFKHFVRDKVVTLEDLWIDIGAKNKQEAQEMVSVGDYMTFSPGVDFLPNHLIATKAADNRVSVFIIASVLRNLAHEEINTNIYFVSSVQEETWIRGAITSTFQIEPHIGIALDLTHATDYPTIDKTYFSDIKLNQGPVIVTGSYVNQPIFKFLKNLAKEKNISHQIEAVPIQTYTDVDAMQISKAGVATGLICIPNRYMHSPSEMVSLSDVEGAIDLLTHFCRKMDDHVNLIP
ncbi:MAG: M42 family metallopeptidase [Candidatus Omnitrophota bacterium]